MALTSVRVRPPAIVFLGQSILTVLLATCPAAGQDQLSPPISERVHAPDIAGGETSESPAIKANPQPVVSNDRLFFALPNFLTVESTQKLQPLTPQRKFKLVARSAFDPVELPLYGLRAGLMQAENRPSSYGQGLAGYGKRYTLAFADCTVDNFMAGAVFPSLLHQDPRYYRMAQGPKRRRLAYAASRVFMTRADSGVEQFNYSEIVGGAVAASISAYGYHPPEDRSLGDVASTWGSQIAFHTFTLVMREFWPDIRRKLSHAP